MLKIRDIVAREDLRLQLVAGRSGLLNTIRWAHISELPDPTVGLEGGELLLTLGGGIGEVETAQREYVRRLAAQEASGLGVSVGVALPEIPRGIVDEAELVGLPVISVPATTSFVTLTKLVLLELATEPVTAALKVNDEFVRALLAGATPRDILAILCGAIGGSMRLSDTDHIIAEHHARTQLDFEDALELVIDDGEDVRLHVARIDTPLDEFGRLVLRHGQNALALELERSRSVQAAELRLAGDLLHDLERERLNDREVAERLAAFGLDPQRAHVALLAVPTPDLPTVRLRGLIARTLGRSGFRFVAANRPDEIALLIDGPEAELRQRAQAIASEQPGVRVALGRPAVGPALGRSLLEAKAALSASSLDVVSYRDLSSLELLLSVPVPALEAYVDRVLGPAVHSAWLLETLAAILESGGVWKDAAERLGVHRHTLRYRMERLEEQTGRHPDNPEHRMELWLALKAIHTIELRGSSAYETRTDQV